MYALTGFTVSHHEALQSFSREQGKSISSRELEARICYPSSSLVRKLVGLRNFLVTPTLRSHQGRNNVLERNNDILGKREVFRDV